MPRILTRAAAAIAVLLVAGAAFGAGPGSSQIEASVSADTVALDETLKLVVTLSRDASVTYQGYLRPDSKDFDVLSQAESESTQWTFSNGVQTTRTIEQHVYIMRPKHKGACTIGPAIARIGGQELKSREIVVKVNPPSKHPSNEPVQLDPFAPPSLGEPEGMRGDEDVFVEVHTDKPQVYVGEQVIVTWTLFTRTDVLRYRTVTEPKHDDFWSEELYAVPGKLAWTRQTVKGQSYEAAPLLKRALFPLHAGKLVVTPLEAETTTLQTAFYAAASSTRGSKPLSIEVLPLPAAGRPEGFETPNVGQFEVMDSVDNTRPKAGEALTWRIIVKGRGNLRNLKLPRPDRDGRLEGFKVYEPQVLDAVQKTDNGIEGTKILSYLLLPRKGGQLTVPAIDIPYFDPSSKSYAHATAAAINITVLGDPEKIGMGAADSKENVLAPKIKPLHNKQHVSSRIGEKVLRGSLLWIFIAVPPALLAVIVTAGAIRARLRRETAGSRRRRARAQARRRMRAAELHIKSQQPSAFFAECARAIYEGLESRLGTKCESYTMDELRRVLIAGGFDETLGTAIVGELESSDFARFAASASGPGEMRATIRRVRQLLSAIDRAPLRGVREVAA